MSDDDTDVFRKAMSDVRRLESEAPPPRAPRPPAKARFRRQDESRVLTDAMEGELQPEDMETGEELTFRRTFVRPGILRRLRRGHYPCTDELDLHGLTVPEARRALGEFLAEALRGGHRCVRIIHGKGLRSGHRGPVLKSRVGRWLMRRDEVLAYSSARPVDGGTGAVYVLLSD